MGPALCGVPERWLFGSRELRQAGNTKPRAQLDCEEPAERHGFLALPSNGFPETSGRSTAFDLSTDHSDVARKALYKVSARSKLAHHIPLMFIG